jgi:hypothetical protein
MKRYSAVCLALVLTGCASAKGFHREEMREAMKEAGQEELQVTDTGIAEALSKKAQLPKPFRVAVYFKGKNYNDLYWRWTADDKQKLFTIQEEIAKFGEISAVMPLSQELIEKEDIASLRLAAARQGADALLVVNGIAEEDHYSNKWALSYMLVAPALFVPGEELDVLFLARASLWDVRNEFLYLSAEAESVSHQKRAPLGIDSREALAEAKKQAIEGLRKELAMQFSAWFGGKKEMKIGLN